MMISSVFVINFLYLLSKYSNLMEINDLGLNGLLIHAHYKLLKIDFNRFFLLNTAYKANKIRKFWSSLTKINFVHIICPSWLGKEIPTLTTCSQWIILEVWQLKYVILHLNIYDNILYGKFCEASHVPKSVTSKRIFPINQYKFKFNSSKLE